MPEELDYDPYWGNINLDQMLHGKTPPFVIVRPVKEPDDESASEEREGE